MTDHSANGDRLQATIEEVRAMAAEAFQCSPESLTVDSTPETVEGWDSLHHLNLVIAIETRYGIVLDPLEAAELTNITALAEAIVARQS